MTIFGTGRTEFRFFWWWEVVAFGSIEEARAAVNLHRQDPRIMARFRALLCTSGGLSKPEDEVAEEIADLLSKGDLVTERWPFHPYWRRQDVFGERNYARQFLSEFGRNPMALDGFRARFCNRNADAALHFLTDAQVIAGMAELLKSGELLVGYYGPPSGASGPKEGPSAGGDDSQEEPSPRSASSPVEEQEEPTFANHDGAAQAATLEKGAAKGAPFCEVCSHGG